MLVHLLYVLFGVGMEIERHINNHWHLIQYIENQSYYSCQIIELTNLGRADAAVFPPSAEVYSITNTTRLAHPVYALSLSEQLLAFTHFPHDLLECRVFGELDLLLARFWLCI